MPHTENRLLAALSPSDLALLKPHLKTLQVKQHQILFEPGDKLYTTYFPLTAIVSLVVLLSKGESVEAAMVGRDGVVSATAALDGKMAVNRGVVQLAGEILSCDSNELKIAAKKVTLSCLCCSGTNRLFFHKHSSRRHAWRTT
jgi:CRP-like cAMP-binding protein